MPGPLTLLVQALKLDDPGTVAAGAPQDPSLLAQLAQQFPRVARALQLTAQPDFRTTNEPPTPQMQADAANPMLALRGAQTIGASRVGERYLLPERPTTMDVVRGFMGAERPRGVAAQDPFGIGAWQQGAGPMPIFAAMTGEVPRAVPAVIEEAAPILDPGMRPPLASNRRDFGTELEAIRAWAAAGGDPNRVPK